MAGNVSCIKFNNFKLTFLIACVFTSALSQKLKVVNLSNPDVVSVQEGYQQENWDIIWNISYPAEISFTTLDIDSQSGDFLVICEYPLPSGDKFSDGAPAEEVIGELPIEESLLLTYLKPEDQPGEKKELIVRIRSEHGGFIYFHSAKRSQNKQTQKITEAAVAEKPKANPNAEDTFAGIAANVAYLELNPLPATTTTTERLTTPAPGKGIYLWKHVIGRTPQEFYQNLNQFKQAIANMADAYCKLKEITPDRQIELNDIRLDNTTIFFCDHKIQESNGLGEKCVQIQLAITIRESGKYLMTTDKLEEMWGAFAIGFLKSIGMRPFYPNPEKRSVTWEWIASSLGVLLALATILCFVFAAGMVKRTHEPVSTIIGEKKGKDSSVSSIADQKTVIEDIIEDLFSNRNNQDAELMGMNESGYHNMKSFDNPAFINDDNRGSFRSPAYYPSRHSGNSSSTSGHHVFQVQVDNHTSGDSYEVDSDEDMEIYNSAPGIIY